MAGVLSKLGVFMGDRLMEANPLNESGFFQDIEFEQLFDECPEWMPEYPSKNLCDANALQSLIEQRCKKNKVWGLKIRLGAFIVNELEKSCDVRLIVTQRDRQASIDSLAKWSEPQDQDPEQVIDRALAAVSQACEGRSYMLVPYNDLLTDPEAKVSLLASHTGQPEVPDAVSFINPALKHY